MLEKLDRSRLAGIIHLRGTDSRNFIPGSDFSWTLFFFSLLRLFATLLRTWIMKKYLPSMTSLQTTTIVTFPKRLAIFDNPPPLPRYM